MRIRPIHLFCLLVIRLLSHSCPASGQDALPVRHVPFNAMQAVECAGSVSVICCEDLDNPGSFLYCEWSNSLGFTYEEQELPDSLIIYMDNFYMPVGNVKITDVFGYRPRRRRMHYGIDIKLNTGDTVRAAFDGRIRVSQYDRNGYGYYLLIRHPNGLETLYAHLSKKIVDQNDIVKAGDPIGLGGSTGRSTGSHLHFETRILGVAFNPASLFDFPNQTSSVDVFTYYKDNKKNGSESYYRVKSGDTLSRIAVLNETTVSELCKLNQISRSSVIRPGQTLRVN